MANKRLLIVDDSEVDRRILRNILCRRFEVAEVENGYSALELLTRKAAKIDGVLLDLSMPVLDGFNVLNVMSENGIKIPVVLVTAEATAENVQRASKYDIADFISKPFDSPTVLEKVGRIFGVEADPEVVKSTEEHYESTESYSTESYVSKLTAIYDTFLKNVGMDPAHCERVSKLTEILLIEYGLMHKSEIDVIDLKVMGKAAYFYNIGLMCVPTDCYSNKNRTPSQQAMYEDHTVMGAKIVRLNESANCKQFIKACSEICMHHHERYDGKGFPHGLKGDDNLIQSQICGFVIRFDRMFNARQSRNDTQFDFVMNELRFDRGAFSADLFRLAEKCRYEILDYYKSLEV